MSLIMTVSPVGGILIIFLRIQQYTCFVILGDVFPLSINTQLLSTGKYGEYVKDMIKNHVKYDI